MNVAVDGCDSERKGGVTSPPAFCKFICTIKPQGSALCSRINVKWVWTCGYVIAVS